MDKIIDDFIASLKVTRSGSKATMDAYARDINRLAVFLETNGIDDFNRVDKFVAMEYLNYLRSGNITEKKISNATYARSLSALRSFYRYLMDNGICDHNPFIYFKNVKLSRKLPEVLTFNQAESILNTFDMSDDKGIRDRTIIETIYACGLRVSEACTLKSASIDFNQTIIHVIGKGNKERIVPYYPRLNTLLKMYIEHYRNAHVKDECDYLFINHNGKRISPRSIQMILDRAAADAKLKMHVHPHMLRHSFATLMLEEGADLRSIQTLLGHENLSTTQIYTHLNYDSLKKTVDESLPLAKKDLEND